MRIIEQLNPVSFFLRFYLFVFREKGKEGEKHRCVVASHVPPTEDLACNTGMCPDWESNQQLLGSQAHAQSTEPYQSGHFHSYFLKRFYSSVFREKGRVGEREGEKQHYVVALMCPLLRTWPATQARALTGNGTSDPLVHRPALNPLSHTSQGSRFLSMFSHSQL